MDCSQKAYHPWLALIFTLFFGLVLVAIAVALNLGVSPTLDSLLFFIQVCVCVCSICLEGGRGRQYVYSAPGQESKFFDFEL